MTNARYEQDLNKPTFMIQILIVFLKKIINIFNNNAHIIKIVPIFCRVTLYNDPKQ